MSEFIKVSSRGQEKFMIRKSQIVAVGPIETLYYDKDVLFHVFVNGLDAPIIVNHWFNTDIEGSEERAYSEVEKARNELIKQLENG